MKRWARLVAAVAVVAGLAVTLSVLRSTEERRTAGGAGTSDVVTTRVQGAADEDADRVVLLDTPREEIRTITVERRGSNGGVLTLRTDGDTLVPAYPHPVRFDRSLVARIISSAGALTSRRTLPAVEDPAPFGLDLPQATVAVELADGTTQTVEIGGHTPARDAFYVMRPGDPAVYVVSAARIAPFFATVEELRDRSITLPATERLQVVEIHTTTGRTVRVEPLPEEDDDPETGLAAYVVTEPFGRRYGLNTTWMESFAGDLEGLRIERFAADAVTDLAPYGLDAPRARLWVGDGETVLNVAFGVETAEGRYARFLSHTRASGDSATDLFHEPIERRWPREDTIVVLSGGESLINVRPYATVSPFALIVNIDRVERLVVESDVGDRFVGRIERDGEEERYALNDVQIDEDRFKHLYQWAIGLQFDAEIPGGSQAPGMEAAADGTVITITYDLTGDAAAREVVFVPFDDTFSAVVRNGQAEFVIATAKLSRMLAAFRQAVQSLQVHAAEPARPEGIGLRDPRLPVQVIRVTAVRTH